MSTPNKTQIACENVFMALARLQSALTGFTLRHFDDPAELPVNAEFISFEAVVGQRTQEGPQPFNVELNVEVNFSTPNATRDNAVYGSVLDTLTSLPDEAAAICEAQGLEVFITKPEEMTEERRNTPNLRVWRFQLPLWAKLL